MDIRKVNKGRVVKQATLEKLREVIRKRQSIKQTAVEQVVFQSSQVVRQERKWSSKQSAASAAAVSDSYSSTDSAVWNSPFYKAAITAHSASSAYATAPSYPAVSTYSTAPAYPALSNYSTGSPDLTVTTYSPVSTNSPFSSDSPVPSDGPASIESTASPHSPPFYESSSAPSPWTPQGRLDQLQNTAMSSTQFLFPNVEAQSTLDSLSALLQLPGGPMLNTAFYPNQFPDVSITPSYSNNQFQDFQPLNTASQYNQFPQGEVGSTAYTANGNTNVVIPALPGLQDSAYQYGTNFVDDFVEQTAGMTSLETQQQSNATQTQQEKPAIDFGCNIINACFAYLDTPK